MTSRPQLQKLLTKWCSDNEVEPYSSLLLLWENCLTETMRRRSTVHCASMDWNTRRTCRSAKSAPITTANSLYQQRGVAVLVVLRSSKAKTRFSTSESTTRALRNGESTQVVINRASRGFVVTQYRPDIRVVGERCPPLVLIPGGKTFHYVKVPRFVVRHYPAEELLGRLLELVGIRLLEHSAQSVEGSNDYRCVAQCRVSTVYGKLAEVVPQELTIRCDLVGVLGIANVVITTARNDR
jgi:hypothetical protein